MNAQTHSHFDDIFRTVVERCSRAGFREEGIRCELELVFGLSEREAQDLLSRLGSAPPRSVSDQSTVH